MEPTEPRRNSKAARFADPWRFRDRAKWSEPAADLHGRPIQPRFYRRGGVNAVCSLLDSSEERFEAPPRPNEWDSRASLHRRQSATMARYRRDEWCTETELRTIESLWIEGVSLRKLARREDVTPTAIGDRVARLSLKAPEFWNWWRLKNVARRRHVS
jgi:hypothetical protein